MALETLSLSLDVNERARKKIKRHGTNILNTIEHGLSSAKCEAVNCWIKLVLRRAYGFLA